MTNEPCAAQIRLRTTAILSLLAALFGVGLVAMEAISRTRELACADATATAVSVAPGDAEQAREEAQAARAALAAAEARVAELEQAHEQLLQETTECQTVLDNAEQSLLETQRQRAATEDATTAIQCGKLLADLGTLGVRTRLTESGLLIELSADELRFASGSAELPQGPGRERLQSLATWLSMYPGQSVRVLGYTDSSGEATANLALSEARAIAVHDALIDAGVAEKQLSAEGRGAADPIADNATPEGREQNRRVELLLEVTAEGD
jgi:outer membrane protein OmpA-like peptidoglycan-associated protein